LALLNAKKWLTDAETFHQSVCNCAECRAVLSGEIGNFVEFGRGNAKTIKRARGYVRIEYPTSATKEHCLRHYLQRKAIEYKFAATASPEQITSNLENGATAFEELLGLDGVGHLRLWRQVLAP
jgi:hypothetical protein